MKRQEKTRRKNAILIMKWKKNLSFAGRRLVEDSPQGRQTFDGRTNLNSATECESTSDKQFSIDS